MKDTVGIITAKEHRKDENGLLRESCPEALPFAGKYRLVDFALSCMTNSGIERIAVEGGENPSSLFAHLGEGETWSLRKREQGLTLIGSPKADDKARKKALTDFLKHTGQRLVLVCGGSIVINADFRQLYRLHRSKRADISVMCKRTPQGESASLGIYLLERRLFLKLSEEAKQGDHEAILENAVHSNNGLSVSEFEFGGYSRRVDSAKAYFEANTDMLCEAVRRELFGGGGVIYTRAHGYAPTRYGDSASVYDSLVADGSCIDGEVISCVVSEGVRIGKGARAESCVLMERCFVGNGASLKYVILDKDCVVREGARLCGQRSLPLIIAKGAVI